MKQARQDAQKIINSGGFEEEITISNPSGILIVQVKGLHSKHWLVHDTDGNLVNGKNAHVTISEKELNEKGIVTRNSNTGNVGIGTTTPEATLEIAKSTSGTTDTFAVIKNVNSQSNTGAHIALTGTGGGKYNSVYGTGDGRLFFFTNADSLTGLTSATPKMTILSGGNVGIGTASPANRLQIASASDDTGVPFRIGSYGALNFISYTAAHTYGSIYSGSGERLTFGAGADSQHLVILPTSGNVGIGTTAPLNLLNLYGADGTSYLRITDAVTGTTATDGARFGYNAGILRIQNYETGGFDILNSSGASTARFTESGNLGVGTTTPSYKLSVSGSGFFDGGTVYTSSLVATSSITAPTINLTNLAVNGSTTLQNFTFQYATGTAATTTNLYVSNLASTTALRVANTATFGGNVGIGTNGPVARLQVSGGAILLDNNQYLQAKDTGGTARSILGMNNGDVIHLGGGSANNVNIAAGGGDVLLPGSGAWKSTGNVGIGTTNPSFPLDVQAATSVIRAKSTTAANEAYFDATDGTTRVLHGVNNDTGSVITGGIANSGFLTTMGAQALQLGTNATAQLTVLSGGNVGIGTTGPVSKLEVVTTSDTTGTPTAYDSKYFTVGTGGATGGSVFISYDQTNNRGYIGALTPGTAWRNLILQPGGGNVGIGTTSANAPLHIVKALASDGDLAILQDSTTNVGLNIRSNTSISGLATKHIELMGNSGASDLALSGSTGARAALVVKASGNIGINTVSPNFKLEVNGSASTTNLYATAATTTDLYVSNLASTTALRVANTATFGGKVGIGTNSPSAPLHVYSSVASQLLVSGYSTVSGANTGVGQLLLGPTASDQGKISYNSDGTLRIESTWDNANSAIYLYNRTAGTGVGMVVKNGNVGIGTTNPGQNLQVAGGNLYVSNGYAQAGSALMQAGTSKAIFGSNAASTGILITRNASDSGKDLFINSGGLIGVGTTTPAHQLTIASSTGPQLSLTDGVAGSLPFAFRQVGSALYIATSSQTSFATSTNNIIAINGNSGNVTFNQGYVGIGTASPAQKLEVLGNIRATGGASNASLIFKTDASSNTTAITSFVADARFGFINTTGGESLSILNSGNVGIGKTTPATLLEIGNNSTAGVTGKGHLVINGTNAQSDGIYFNRNVSNEYGWVNMQGGSLRMGSRGGASTNGYIQFVQYDGTTLSVAMELDSSGNMGIGTATHTSKLDVYGDIRVGTSGSNGCLSRYDGTVLVGSCSSDIRLKKNVESISNILGKFTQLNPVTYEWRADEFPQKHFGTNRVYGLIADEVQTLFPELVATDKDGYKTLDYGVALNMLAISAIKEVNGKLVVASSTIAEIGDRVGAVYSELSNVQMTIESHDERIGVLETKVADLESQLALIATSTSSGQATSIATSTEATSTNATSTISVASIFDELWTNIVNKLAMVSNGINDFFASKIHTRELCLRDDSGELCISRVELEQLLSNANISYSVANGNWNGGNTTGGSGGTGTTTQGGAGDTGTTTPDAGSGNTGTTTPDVVGEGSATSTNP